MAQLILFNKPFGVLSQFRRAAPGAPTLADFIALPEFYPAGRLDKDSEGLLLLTDSGDLQARISQPGQKMPKTYWVQVEGTPDEMTLNQLRKGVKLKDGVTRPAKVRKIDCPLPPRDPPIRKRKQIPDSWLELTITEGRNRQVRRMTASVGFPTLRLFRCRIGPWQLGDLASGQSRLIEVHLPRGS